MKMLDHQVWMGLRFCCLFSLLKDLRDWISVTRLVVSLQDRVTSEFNISLHCIQVGHLVMPYPNQTGQDIIYVVKLISKLQLYHHDQFIDKLIEKVLTCLKKIRVLDYIINDGIFCMKYNHLYICLSHKHSHYQFKTFFFKFLISRQLLSIVMFLPNNNVNQL